MDFDLAATKRLLARSPGILEGLLHNLDESWTVYDLGHIAQTCKAMSFQYQEQVGPWREYISIIKSPARYAGILRLTTPG